MTNQCVTLHIKRETASSTHAVRSAVDQQSSQVVRSAVDQHKSQVVRSAVDQYTPRIWPCVQALWILLLITQFALASEFPYAKPYFETIGDLEDIPGGVVTSIARGSDGLMWLGTQEGLLRYDGYQFQRFQADPRDQNSLAGNFIRALEFDARGRLWVATFSNGLSVFDVRKRKFSNLLVRSDDGLISERLVGFAVDPKGMWVASDLGLQLFDEQLKLIETYRLPQSPDKPDSVRSVLRTKAGTIWLGSNAGLRVRQAGESEFAVFAVSEEHSFKDQVVNTLFEDDLENIWVGTRLAGLVRMRADGTDFQRLRASTDGGNSMQSPERLLLGDRIQAITQVRRLVCRVACSTRLDKDQHVQTAPMMWVASTLGLHAIDQQSLQVLGRYTHAPAEPGALAIDAIGALFADEAGWMWIGTWGGGLQKTVAIDARVRSIRSVETGIEGLSFADAHALLELENGQLLVGTGGAGLQLLDRQKGRVDTFNAGTGRGALSDGVVIALAQSPDGRIWVGTQRGGLFLFDLASRQFTHIGESQTVSNLLVESNTRLWLGTSKGVTQLDTQSLVFTRMLDTDQKPILGQINPLALDQQGRIWAGSAEGLRVLLPGETQFRAIRHDPKRADSLLNNSIYGLLADARGRLWVATEQGLDELELSSLLAPFEAQQLRFKHWGPVLNRAATDFGANLMLDGLGRIWTEKLIIDVDGQQSLLLSKVDGLDVGTIWNGAYARLKNGFMLQGGTKGIAVIDADRFVLNSLAAKPMPVALRINGQERALEGLSSMLSLQPEERSFAVEFSNPDFSAPSLTQYRYRLLGFDQDWIATTALSRVASYSNLWPGEYALEVHAIGRTGLSSALPLRLPIKVVPAFWQTGWFALLSGATVLGAIWFGMALRTRRLAALAENLERQVTERTSDLSASNHELKRSNLALELAQEHLIAAQEQLVMQEKMASLGQLVAGLAHEVNTPIGIAITASSHLEEATRVLSKNLQQQTVRKSDLEQFAADAQSASLLVSQNLTRAAKLVSQFKQVSATEQASEVEQIDLQTFLPSAVSSLEPLWRHQSVRFVLAPVPPLSVRVNTGALTQILSNLIQNAVLHAFEGRKESQISLSVESHSERVSFIVSDDGMGMDAQTLQRVFDPFFTTKRNQGGTGLGLHIAYNLATKMSGTLRASSELNQGSRFELCIPMQRSLTDQVTRQTSLAG
jgi:signal transduction histidine kinase/ligand-binding sensor domain-containing protein